MGNPRAVILGSATRWRGRGFQGWLLPDIASRVARGAVEEGSPPRPRLAAIVGLCIQITFLPLGAATTGGPFVLWPTAPTLPLLPSPTFGRGTPRSLRRRGHGGSWQGMAPDLRKEEDDGWRGRKEDATVSSRRRPRPSPPQQLAWRRQTQQPPPPRQFAQRRRPRRSTRPHPRSLLCAAGGVLLKCWV
jgi:hypothetical protein